MNQLNETTQNKSRFMQTIDNVNGGIAIPAIMYFMGVPLVVVVLLWALFFRG